MAEIDNLSISITSNADGAVNALNRLASVMGRVGGSSKDAASGVKAVDSGVKELSSTTQRTNENTKTASQRLREFGEEARRSGEKAKKGEQGVAKFLAALKRVAFYRIVRSILREIAEGFNEGIKNLYYWSSAVNGHFANSMNRLATSTLYLKNSLAAMVSPLIESFIPVLDVIIDKIVEVLNFFNMLVAAVSGADTYTVAKKAATVWDNSASKTKKSVQGVADEIKRTILGFDEINKLVKPGSSGGSGGYGGGGGGTDYSSMFEEKPLTGIFKKISDITKGWPDWLKWLLGIGSVAIAAWGIKQLPKLLKKAYDLLKNLFALKVPEWFNNLFGSKDGGESGLNIPDKITLPDADVTTNLQKGDWSALDDLEDKHHTIYISPKLDNTAAVLWENFKKEWNDARSKLYASPKLDNTGTIIWNNFKKEWDNARAKLYASPKLDNTGKALWNSFKKEWDNAKAKLYVSPKLDNTGKVLWNNFKKGWDDAKTKLYASPKLDNTGKVLWDNFKKAWNDAKTSLYVSVKLDNTGKVLWNTFKREWDNAKTKLYLSPALDNTGKVIWLKFKKEWDNAKAKLYASPKLDNTGKALWNNFKKHCDKAKTKLYVSPVLDNASDVLFNNFKKEWDRAKKKLYVSPKLDNTGRVLWNTFKKNWDDSKTSLYLSPKLDNTGKALWKTFKKDWDDSKTDLTANIKLVKYGWTTVTKYLDDSFGGATGGGGTTAGGGAGRKNRYDVEVGIKDPTESGVKAYWKSLKGYWNSLAESGVTGLKLWFKDTDETTAGTLFGKLKKAWNSYLNTNDAFLKMIIKPYAYSNTPMINLKNVQKWLFGETVPSVPITFTAKEGTGLTHSGSGGSFKLEPKVSAVDTTVTVNPVKAWAGTIGGILAYLGINALSTDVTIDAAPTWLGSLYDFLGLGDLSASAYIDLSQGWIGDVISALGLDGLYTSVTVGLKADPNANEVKVTSSGSSGGGGGTTWKMAIMKAGGIIFGNGMMSPFPAYASGTSNAHGSLFMAGEAGPEIVGHLGNRTEVLNKSQIASAMYDAVRSAMNGISLEANFSYDGYGSGAETETTAALMSMIEQDSAATRQQNELLRQQNELLRQINEKEFGVSTRAINAAQTRMNRRSGVTVVPVG